MQTVDGLKERITERVFSNEYTERHNGYAFLELDLQALDILCRRKCEDERDELLKRIEYLELREENLLLKIHSQQQTYITK